MHIEIWEMIEKEKQDEMIWNMLLDLFRKEIEFNSIQGYDDIKDIVRRALDAEDNYNLLFIGPPASENFSIKEMTYNVTLLQDALFGYHFVGSQTPSIEPWGSFETLNEVSPPMNAAVAIRAVSNYIVPFLAASS